MYKVNASKVKELQKKYFTEDEPTEIVFNTVLEYSILYALKFKSTYLGGMVVTWYEKDTYHSSYDKSGEWLWYGYIDGELAKNQNPWPMGTGGKPDPSMVNWLTNSQVMSVSGTTGSTGSLD